MINFFKNFLKLINYKKNEKFFKRVIFIENKNVLKYLEPILAKYKKGSCIISLTKIPEEKFDNISHYYFDNNSVFSILSLLLKVRLIYATTPDLNNSIFLKSIYNKTKYLYIQHSPASLCAIYNHDAFIHYDYVQVVNKNQYQDVLDINRLYKKKIKPIKSEYLFLRQFDRNNLVDKKEIDFLIAPSWSSNFYQLNLHNQIFNILRKSNKSFIFRPHYMSIRKKEFSLKDLELNDSELDLGPNFTLNNYKNLITDWSGIFFEFLIIKKKKPILINSKMKVRNKNYQAYTLKPIELELRDSLAKQFNPDSLDNFSIYIKENSINLNNDIDEINKVLDLKFYQKKN